MNVIPIEELEQNKEYYIEYIGLDQEDYVNDENYSIVRKIGTFTNWLNGEHTIARFDNVSEVKGGTLKISNVFRGSTIAIATPPYIVYEKMSEERRKEHDNLLKQYQEALEKVIDEGTNKPIGKNVATGIFSKGGKRSRKNRKTRKNRKNRKK